MGEPWGRGWFRILACFVCYVNFYRKRNLFNILANLSLRTVFRRQSFIIIFSMLFLFSAKFYRKWSIFNFGLISRWRRIIFCMLFSLLCLILSKTGTTPFPSQKSNPRNHPGHTPISTFVILPHVVIKRCTTMHNNLSAFYCVSLIRIFMVKNDPPTI